MLVSCCLLQGVNVYITVWDKDSDLATFRQQDMVDEFSFDYTDTPGNLTSVMTIDGIRNSPTT